MWTARALALPLLVAAGCGYAASGTWEDDPGNWGRAFGSTPPDDAEVVHSYYARSPHFTMEFRYYFHVRAHAGLREQLFRENALAPVAGEPLSGTFGAPPDWFPQRGDPGYDAWGFADDPESRFRLLIDRTTADLFLTDNVQ